MRAYALTCETTASWQPHPGDLVWAAPNMLGQWPPDGCRYLLSGTYKFNREIEWCNLDQGGPMLVTNVCPIGPYLTDVLVVKDGRLWWYPLTKERSESWWQTYGNVP